jgi:gluconolactonase
MTATKAAVICCAGLVHGALLVALSAQAPSSETTRRLDPAFDAVVSPGATMELVKDGFGFINGIVWVKDGGGHLLISDIPANVVHKWTPDGKMAAFLEKPDWTRTTGRPPAPRFGANGITLDPQGRVVYAAEADRAVVRLERDGQRTVLADRYDGKRLNSPNDLVYRSDGALYFTDPSGGNRFADWDLKKELPYQGVFLLKDGKLQLVVQDLERPNGIALSTDEKFLYVNESVKRAILRYEVQRDGSLGRRSVFADMSGGTGTGNPDGMKFDAKGNLYSVGPGGIWVFSPEGKHLGMIVPPEFAPGFAFGDADGRTLYMAASTRLARIRVNNAGAR